MSEASRLEGFKVALRMAFFLCAVTLLLVKPSHGQDCTTLIADSEAEFSDTQGQDGWNFGYYDGDSASPFTPSDFEEFPIFDSGVWKRSSVICGAGFYCTYVAAMSAHPNGTVTPAGLILRENNYSVYRWISDISGEVEVAIDATDLATGGPDNGVRVHLFVEDVEESDIVVGVGGSATDQVLTSISIGTIVDIALDSNGGNDLYDTTRVLVSIRSCETPLAATSHWARIVMALLMVAAGTVFFCRPILSPST
jgi:hypothetical protein